MDESPHCLWGVEQALPRWFATCLAGRGGRCPRQWEARSLANFLEFKCDGLSNFWVLKSVWKVLEGFVGGTASSGLSEFVL